MSEIKIEWWVPRNWQAVHQGWPKLAGSFFEEFAT